MRLDDHFKNAKTIRAEVGHLIGEESSKYRLTEKEYQTMDYLIKLLIKEKQRRQ